MSLDQIIKLFINQFVFLFCAWSKSESRLKLRALSAFVLLLAQCLKAIETEREKREKDRESGRERKGEWEWCLWMEVLTHSLCLLIIRSMSSLILRYLSSDSGLWPTESSASGSGLSHPFRPFFLNVCKHSVQMVIKCQVWKELWGRNVSLDFLGFLNGVNLLFFNLQGWTSFLREICIKYA